jgi:AraC-like DNA-binding protein
VRKQVLACDSFPAHTHISCEVALVLSGRYECLLNGARIALEPGQLLLVQPTDVHEDFYQPDSDLVFLTFIFYDFSGRLWKHGLISGDAPVEARRLSLAQDQLLGDLFGLFLRSGPDQNVKRGLGESLLWRLLAVLPESSLLPEFQLLLEQNAFQRKVASAFQERLFESLDVGSLASNLGLSKRALEYKFRRYFKESPAHAFMACKMRYAVQLLEQGEDVKAVAAKLGFSNPFYFSTAFKRVIGYPPSHTETGRGKGGSLRKNEGDLR